jgi:hypothetical protein
MTIEQAIQASVQKNVPQAYQAFVIAQLTSVAEQLLTPEMVTAVIKKLVDAMSNSDIATAYSMIVDLKTESEAFADGNAAVAELDKLNADEITSETNRANWITSFLTGLVLIALTAARAA